METWIAVSGYMLLRDAPLHALVLLDATAAPAKVMGQPFRVDDRHRRTVKILQADGSWKTTSRDVGISCRLAVRPRLKGERREVEPVKVEAPARVCGYEGCGRSLAGAHVNRAYCSMECKRFAFVDRRREKAAQEPKAEPVPIVCAYAECGATIPRPNPGQMYCGNRCGNLAWRAKQRAKKAAPLAPVPAPAPTPPPKVDKPATVKRDPRKRPSQPQPVRLCEADPVPAVLSTCERDGCDRPVIREGGRFCSRDCHQAWKRVRRPMFDPLAATFAKPAPEVEAPAVNGIQLSTWWIWGPGRVAWPTEREAEDYAREQLGTGVVLGPGAIKRTSVMHPPVKGDDGLYRFPGGDVVDDFGNVRRAG